MGLDMYLYIRETKYESRYSTGEGKTNPVYPDELKQFAKDIEKDSFSSITTQIYYLVGYWRKFNALHNYIVQNYADGIDQCQSIYLNKDNIQEIRNICFRIITDPKQATSLMPCAQGFFFGSQEYDEDYLVNVEDTLHLFNKILVFFEQLDKHNFNYDLVYEASW